MVVGEGGNLVEAGVDAVLLFLQTINLHITTPSVTGVETRRSVITLSAVLWRHGRLAKCHSCYHRSDANHCRYRFRQTSVSAFTGIVGHRHYLELTIPRDSPPQASE